MYTPPPHTTTTTHFAKTLRREMTPPERRLWYDFLKNKSVEGTRWRRQMPILKYIADFACPELQLILEVDGAIHDEQFEYDDERTAVIRELWWEVYRVGAQWILANFEGTCEHLREVIQLRKAWKALPETWE